MKRPRLWWTRSGRIWDSARVDSFSETSSKTLRLAGPSGKGGNRVSTTEKTSMRTITQVASFFFITFVIVLCPGACAQQTRSAEQELFHAVNQERRAHGLPSLQWDEALANAAHTHAERMAQQGTISH